jgi:hypothetical protein
MGFWGWSAPFKDPAVSKYGAYWMTFGISYTLSYLGRFVIAEAGNLHDTFFIAIASSCMVLAINTARYPFSMWLSRRRNRSRAITFTVYNTTRGNSGNSENCSTGIELNTAHSQENMLSTVVEPVLVGRDKQVVVDKDVIARNIIENMCMGLEDAVVSVILLGMLGHLPIFYFQNVPFSYNMKSLCVQLAVEITFNFIEIIIIERYQRIDLTHFMKGVDLKRHIALKAVLALVAIQATIFTFETHYDVLPPP